MFDLHYKNGATLHRIITKATEPVKSGKEPFIPLPLSLNQRRRQQRQLVL